MRKWRKVNFQKPNFPLHKELLLLCYSIDRKFRSILAGIATESIDFENYQKLKITFAIKQFCEGNSYLIIEANRIANPEYTGSHFYFGEVTHFMELPELPE